MESSTPLLNALDERKDEISAILGGLRAGKREDVTASVAELVANVASGIPLLGKLAGEAARWVFAKSAYGRLERAAAEIEAELDREASERRLAETIANLVAHALVTLGEREELVERTAAPLDHRLEAFQSEFRPTEILKLEIELVDGGATGVDASGSAQGRQIEIEQKRVTGRGTVGVKL